MPMFDWMRNASLSFLLNEVLQPYSATYKIGLLTKEPEPDDTSASLANKEPSGGGYARATILNGSWTTPLDSTNAGPGIVINNKRVVFPKPTGTWGTIIGWVVLGTDSNTGNLQPFVWGPFRPPFTVKGGQPRLVFGPGQIKIVMNQKCIGNVARNNILYGHFSGTGSFPSDYYMGLLTNLPESDGYGANEIVVPNGPSPNGYVRVVIPVDVVDKQFTTPTTGISYNKNNLTFPQCTGGNWGTLPITAWAFFDSAAGLNMWWYGKFRFPLQVQTPTSPQIVIPPGGLSIGIDIGAWG